ncbi:hypothetical protein Tco_0458357 [Tanacetum coccineum]
MTYLRKGVLSCEGLSHIDKINKLKRSFRLINIHLIVIVNLDLEDINIVVEHGLSSENTQSPGGSSDTSGGFENSESFEESGRSNEGLML